MSEKRTPAKKEKDEPYTAADAVGDVVELVVVTPISWLFGITVGTVLDAVS